VEEVKAYIESGILELYVLGQLTVAENAAVEKMASKHGEVKAEIEAIELALEAYAMENSIEPTAALESKILSQFTNTTSKEKSEAKVVPLYEDSSKSTIRTLRFALVACLGLLIMSVVALFSVHKDLNTAKSEIATLNSKNTKFATTVSKLEFDNAGMENRIAMTETSEWTTVKLAGVNKSLDAKMFVYWNKNNKNILINYAAMKLPNTDKSHEYQLWALVDGKPVSLGVFDDTAKEAVVQMQTIEKAQAFAVTVEPTGGSVNPTMDQMIVMGAVSI
jgi:anti-sigma-K factor RskA